MLSQTSIFLKCLLSNFGIPQEKKTLSAVMIEVSLPPSAAFFSRLKVNMLKILGGRMYCIRKIGDYGRVIVILSPCFGFLVNGPCDGTFCVAERQLETIGRASCNIGVLFFFSFSFFTCVIADVHFWKKMKKMAVAIEAILVFHKKKELSLL